MKNSLTILTALGMLAVGAFGQTNTGTRPRVATTPTPPVLQNERVGSRPDGPPVLQGGTGRTEPSATPPPIEDDEIIRVETNLVTMPVSVLDRDGRFISGLQQRDFKIFENGVEQKIEYFQSVEQPFTVAILIDVSPSTQFRMDEIQNAAITFIDQLRPAERVMVIAFDQYVQVMTEPTSNRNQLRNAIRSVQFGDGTSLYEAVDQTIYQHLSRVQGRKAVVLFTDAVDTTSRRATMESTLRATEEVDALFYPIRYDTSGWSRRGGGGNFPPARRGGRVTMADILGAIITGGSVNMGGGGGAGSSQGEYAKGKQYLERLAQNSGGRYFEANSIYNLDAAFSGIAEELRRQYSLGYYPETVGKAGDRKQIKIRVMRPSVMVRAKTSYVVGQTDRNIAGR